MDIRFAPHNSHLQGLSVFERLDPYLYNLQSQPYIFESSLLAELPTKVPGIYTVGGGRQIGKTTLLKQWMLLLLKQGIAPQSIFFLTGEIIDDHHSLLHIVQEALSSMPDNDLKFLILDEVSYIKDWDKGIKYLADSGALEQVILVLTGSDLSFIKEARMRFPGRRGKAEIVDFHLYPLSFREFIILKHSSDDFDHRLPLLFEEFSKYLSHGGYLTAINEEKTHGSITKSTLTTYSDWVRGDCLKRGKREPYLKEFLSALYKTYGTQVTWNALAKHTSIDHPKTVQDYAETLEGMDALFIQHALIEDKLLAAPKKAKKLYLTDPFIYHALHSWIFSPEKEKPANLVPLLVETVVVNHFRRYYPTLYIKGEGEVDIAYIRRNRFWPIEIKWTEQLHPKDLKQILKYKNSLILTKRAERGKIHDIDTLPLPLFLLNIEKYFVDLV